MTDITQTKFNRLLAKLKELFQLDQPDLDFGIYRVLHARAGEISQFLERDLLPQVKTAFAQYQSADSGELKKELEKLVKQLQDADVDPDTSPKVKELKNKLANSSVDLVALESDVYDHLYNFFRRYYDEGDFLSRRVYKEGVYAIPYEGEEVKLHWANKDQYYIKSSEVLRDYAFKLKPESTTEPLRVRFKLVDAAEGEHGNNKAQAGKDRRFQLAPEPFAEVVDGDLEILFLYQPSEQKQKDLNAAAITAISGLQTAALAPWLRELTQPHIRADGEQSGKTRLQVHLERYTARNTFDYFIHKDLGGFLRRELDFYIKNEVMHLDDVESETAPRVEQYLSKIKVIRSIAHKLIAFLAQLEDFQKKLWLKKKFVVETNYCITLDRIPEEFYPEIVANEAQREEWVKLFAIDEIADAPAYSSPLTVEFLKANPFLVLDTALFDDGFKARLLNSIENLEAQEDGTLLVSENYQAGLLVGEKLKGKADLVYLDPPYNTDATPIIYKNGYKDSSWASLMSDRIDLANELVSTDGAVVYAIDDTEASLLKEIVKQRAYDRDTFQCVVEHYPGSGTGRSNITRTHEYCLFSLARNADVLRGDAVDDGERVRGFRRAGTGDNNFRIGNPGRPESFYAVLVNKETFKVEGVEPPPEIGTPYPVQDTAEGFKRVYPIGEDGSERVWTLSFDGVQDAINRGAIVSSDGFAIKRVYQDKDRRLLLPSLWQGAQYNATTGGTNLLTDMFGDAGRFSYPKALGTMERVVDSVAYDRDCSISVDLFGGSGTTAHAVISRNRKYGGTHKYVIVEMGEHADSVIKHRIVKAIYSSGWRGGKPVQRDGISHCFKYLRLESYEDALNNLTVQRTQAQGNLLAGATPALREQYTLNYLLNTETQGSASLLNVQAFADPTAYSLLVKTPGSDESQLVKVDLLETFNWLIGLTVKHIAAPQTVAGEFEQDSEKRLRIKGRLKQAKEGPWWFRTVTGTTPDGRKTLVIWRKLTGDVARDNLVLDEWFARSGYSTKDQEFALIYVNGDNTLENLRAADDTWKLRLIEEDFHRLMFAET